MVALFCYDRDPAMVFGPSYIDELHESMAQQRWFCRRSSR